MLNAYELKVLAEIELHLKVVGIDTMDHIKKFLALSGIKMSTRQLRAFREKANKEYINTKIMIGYKHFGNRRGYFLVKHQFEFDTFVSQQLALARTIEKDVALLTKQWNAVNAKDTLF